MSKIQITLLIVILVSAVSVVAVRHKNRLAFITLQKQEQNHDELQAEWGRLMLEKATLTRHHQVANTALKSLGMSAPRPEKIITLNLAANKETISE